MNYARRKKIKDMIATVKEIHGLIPLLINIAVNAPPMPNAPSTAKLSKFIKRDEVYTAATIMLNIRPRSIMPCAISINSIILLSLCD